MKRFRSWLAAEWAGLGDTGIDHQRFFTREVK
jgi:hypothetical protein